MYGPTPPILKYYGYTGPNFDTPEAACADAIAHSFDFTSQTGGAYDHIEPYTVNVMKCFATFYVNSTPVTSWWSNVLIVRSCDGRGWVNHEITCMQNACPAHSTGTPQINPTSCTCNTGYLPDSTGAYCVPVNLTIKLEGGSTTEPGSTLRFVATVTNQDQPPQEPVTVRISLKVDSKSGGHDHGDSTRPRGGIATVGTCPSDSTCWSETTPANNGVVAFNFVAPAASGKHTVTATCDGCGNTATKSVDVKVPGLKPIPSFPFYALVEANGDVIGVTGLHADNHNLIPAAAGVLMRIATNYHFHPRLRVLDWRTNTMVMPPLLHVNDASLEWGGKFDIKGKWTGSHAEHRRGTSVDLRANENAGAIPPELFEEFEVLMGRIISGDNTVERFLRECTPNERPSESNPNPVQHNRTRENYCVSQVDGSFDTNRHYHVRLLGE